MTASWSVLVLVFVTWLIARKVGRFNVIDVTWGLGFVTVALVALAWSAGHGDTTRRVLVAALVFALLARFAPRPKRIFYIIAAVVFALMFLTPFSIPAAPTLTIVTLEFTHVVVAVGAV